MRDRTKFKLWRSPNLPKALWLESKVTFCVPLTPNTVFPQNFPFLHPLCTFTLIKDNRREAGKIPNWIIICSMFGFFLEGVLPPFHSRDSGFANRYKSGNLLGGHDTLILWFELGFCSLDLELFCSYRSGKNLASPLVNFWEQHY